MSKLTIIAGSNESVCVNYAKSIVRRGRVVDIFCNLDTNYSSENFLTSKEFIRDNTKKFCNALISDSDILAFCSLSSRTFLYYIKQAINAGYEVSIIYVSDDSKQEEAIRSKTNFWSEYRHVCHAWHISDTSNIEICYGYNDCCVVLDEDKFNEFFKNTRWGE